MNYTKCSSCKKRFDHTKVACPRCGTAARETTLRVQPHHIRRRTCCALILLVIASGAVAWSTLDGKPERYACAESIREMPDLKTLLNMTPEELANQDIAVVNLACAEGLKDAETLDKRACLDQLDLWAKEIDDFLKERKSIYQAYHSKTGHSFNQWRCGVIASHLRNVAGVEYTPRLKFYKPGAYDETIYFGSAKDIFIIGAITERNRGTCASLPVLFASIGRRLGYPIKLVTTRNHLFARWDDGKERFNIEWTDRLAEFKPDDFYRRFPATLNAGEEYRRGYLINLTPERELSSFLHLRGLCLRENQRYGEAMDSFLASIRLNPQYSEPPEQNIFIGMVELDMILKNVPPELRRSRR